MSSSLSKYQRSKKDGRCGHCGQANDQLPYVACSRCYTPRPRPRTRGEAPWHLTSQLLKEAKGLRLTGDAVERYICAGVIRVKKRMQYAKRRAQAQAKAKPARRPRHV